MRVMDMVVQVGAGVGLITVGVATAGLVIAAIPVLRAYVRFQRVRLKRVAEGVPVYPDSFAAMEKGARTYSRKKATKNGVLHAVPAWNTRLVRRAIEAGDLYMGRSLWPYRPYPEAPIGTWKERYTRVVAMLFEDDLFVPAPNRKRGVAVFGAAGSGKTTACVYPWLTHVGLNASGNATFALDVKGPDFLNKFRSLYNYSQRPVMVFDPWCPDYSLSFQPLQSVGDDGAELAELTTAILSLAESTKGSGGNESPYWRESARQLLRSLLDVAMYWPFRFRNVPSVVSLIVQGEEKVRAALRNCNGVVIGSGSNRYTVRLLPPRDRVLAAFRLLALTPPPVLLAHRTRGEGVDDALSVLERCPQKILDEFRRVQGEIASTYLGWQQGTAGADPETATLVAKGQALEANGCPFPVHSDDLANALEAIRDASTDGALPARGIMFRATDRQGRMAGWGVTSIRPVNGDIVVEVREDTGGYVAYAVEVAAAAVVHLWTDADAGLKHLRARVGAILDAPDQTFGSTLSTLSQAAANLAASRGIGLYLCRSELHLNDLLAPVPEGKGAPIMVCGAQASQKDSGSYALALAITSLVIAALKARSHKRPGDPARTTHTLNFILDEFAQLKMASDMAKDAPNLLRGYNASWAILVQSLAQLLDEYGPNGAESILTSCLTKVYFPRIPKNHAAKLAAAVGRCTVERVSRDKDGKMHSVTLEEKQCFDEATLPGLTLNGEADLNGAKLALVETDKGFIVVRSLPFWEDPKNRGVLGMVSDETSGDWKTAGELDRATYNSVLPRYMVESIIPGQPSDVEWERRRGEPITKGSHLIPETPRSTSESAQRGPVGPAVSRMQDRTRAEYADPYWPLLHAVLGGFMDIEHYDEVTGIRRRGAQLRYYELKHPSIYATTLAAGVLAVISGFPHPDALPRPQASQPTAKANPTRTEAVSDETMQDLNALLPILGAAGNDT
jgi:hypothetical protein